MKILRQAEQIGNCTAARKFDMSESYIWDRRKGTDLFLQSNDHQQAFHEQKAKFTEVEKTLLLYLNEGHHFGYTISSESDS
jgi:hypothetical protein